MYNNDFTCVSEDTDQYPPLFSCEVASNSLQPHELQHARLPCPSPKLSFPVHLPEFAQTHVHWLVGVSWCETIYHRLGLEPMCWDLNQAKTQFGTLTHMAGTQTHILGLKLSQNPVWDLNPRGWDSNPAKTCSTWFQDQKKLRLLMPHRKKNSVRDKVIGKKWIYSDSERSSLHRVGHRTA